MGKNKLQKFADIESFSNVFQYGFERLRQESFPWKGRWQEWFGNAHPLVLELGCGKGEYTVALARTYPDKNFIGIDIKGARLWSGAKQALEEQLGNAAFLRTGIEALPAFFAPGEVAEIWITFADPQMKKERKRLTSTTFMQLYQQVMQPNGRIHLKTDSPFLSTYTRYVVKTNHLPLIDDCRDVHGERPNDPLLNILTHYERQWMERGLPIHYLCFQLPACVAWQEPEEEIEKDDYRSYNRSRRTAAQHPTHEFIS